jgi:N-acetyl-alpha-D-muramate 1-phosphate uridylyltransferase
VKKVFRIESNDIVSGDEAATPRQAMVLAAGLGRRMLPLTEATPKPLIRIHGKALIDYGLEALARAGVRRVVVNIHHFADQMRAHLAGITRPEIIISDESRQLLDSGGGILKALPYLGEQPFFVINSDSFWIEGYQPNLINVARQWDPERMDILLLLSGMANAIGYHGAGDFTMDAEGRLLRRGERQVSPFAYAGAGILKPELFADPPGDRFSLNVMFDRALEQQRLFGVRLDGLWLHVGTPTAVREAEEAIARSAA